MHSSTTHDRSSARAHRRARGHARALISSLVVTSVASLTATTALAAPDDLAEARARDWEHAPDHVLGPAVPFAEEDEPHTIFVNFDGVTLTEGWPDNARENVTSLTGMGGTYQPYGAEPGDPIRGLILDEVRKDYEGMWVRVTDERPDGGQYTMIIVSPTNASPGKNGVASLNCGGSPLGVGFAFFGGGGSIDEISSTISHEAAHTFGIEHVDNTGDIMYWQAVNTSSIFVDECWPVDDAQPLCAVNHEDFCPAGLSNTRAELIALFGEPSDPDGGAPEVTLVAPVERERFAVGETITIIAEATDDISVSQVKLTVDGELGGTKLQPPYEWTKTDLDEGLHEIAVVARDTGGNETTSMAVTIAVGDVAFPEPEPGEDDGGVPGIDPSAGDDFPDLGLDDDETQGCACTAGPDRPAGLALFLLALVAPLRRSLRRDHR